MNREFKNPTKPQNSKNTLLTLLIYGAIITFCVLAIIMFLNWDPKLSASDNGIKYTVTDSDLKIKISYGVTSAECYIAVKNISNSSLFLDDISVDIETKDGKLAAVIGNVSAHPQVIAPGETAYYYSNSAVSNINAMQDYRMSYDLNIKKSIKGPIRLSTSDVTITKNYVWEAGAVGRITNNTPSSISPCYISIVLFDKNKKLIGCEHDVIYDEIAPGATKSFDMSFLYFDGKYEDIAFFEIYAYPYQYQ